MVENIRALPINAARPNTSTGEASFQALNCPSYGSQDLDRASRDKWLIIEGATLSFYSDAEADYGARIDEVDGLKMEDLAELPGF